MLFTNSTHILHLQRWKRDQSDTQKKSEHLSCFYKFLLRGKKRRSFWKKICFLFTFTHFNISRYKMFIRAFYTIVYTYYIIIWYKRVPKQNVHNAILCMWFWLLVGNLTCASDLWMSSYIFHLFGRMPWGGMKNK